MKVMVLAGGPDREHEVSLHSGESVAAALETAGHDVRIANLTPGDERALDQFQQWQGDCIFPALHGRWGEGGGAQTLMENRGLRYVGSTPLIAELCMDKHRSKLVVQDHNIPTPPWHILAPGEACPLEPPVVVKPIDEGSSIELTICLDEQTRDHAIHELAQHHPRVLVERYIAGREMTVGILAHEPPAAGYEVLPIIEIVPKTAFYDYQAKYLRDDTEYRFDINHVPVESLHAMRDHARAAHSALAARHLSRVDFILDHQGTPWFLEVNTMPGFTDHSLLPKAAAKSGLTMPQLCDRLVRLACDQTR